MYTAQQVSDAYDAMLFDLWGDDWIYDIEICDENDHIDKVATAEARAEERARLDAGRATLASARLVFSRQVCSGNPVPEIIDADGETIIVSVGYTAMTEKFRRVGLKRVDDLISVIECASRFNLTQQAVTQAIDTGKLRAFVQPKAPTRQGRSLISLRDAKKIWG